MGNLYSTRHSRTYLPMANKAGWNTKGEIFLVQNSTEFISALSAEVEMEV